MRSALRLYAAKLQLPQDDVAEHPAGAGDDCLHLPSVTRSGSSGWRSLRSMYLRHAASVLFRAWSSSIDVKLHSVANRKIIPTILRTEEHTSELQSPVHI